MAADFEIKEYERDDLTELERIVIREMYEKGYDYLDPEQIKLFWEREHGIAING